jgi:phosphoglycerol transferase MdoB-like AlkP superfamily enzyme
MAKEFDLKSKESPVFQTVFTLSSHLPYAIPERLKNRFPKGKLAIQQSIAYTDYSLQQYFNQIKQSEAYQNTWFIITADHTAELYRKEYMHIFDYFKVPIIAFHPKLSHFKLITKPVQQLDILPTILNSVGFDQSFFSLGQNLIEEKEVKSRMIVIQNQGTFYGLMDSLVVEFIEPDRFQFFEFKNDNMLPAELDSKTKQNLEQQLKANLQIFRSKMRAGKW